LTDRPAAPRSPFVEALGDEFGRLSPAVARHLRQAAGRSVLAGAVRRSWRRGGALGSMLARLVRVDFGALTAAARFELRNELLPGHAMLWRRVLRDGARMVDAFGIVRWDPRRRALVDTLGRRQAIEVELVPRVEGGALVLASRRQWLRLLGLRIPLPRAVAGSASAHEREGPDGTIVLALSLHHRWLGEYAGYEVELAEVR